MTPTQVAQTYFDAWVRHDASAIVATFADSGTYEDPVSGGKLVGAAIATYASGLWAAFPDLSFEIASISDAQGLVATQWIMTGTNSASFMGLPPTGKKVRLLGADFVHVENGKIRSVVGYFDSGELPRQLGLQVVVQPREIGPVQFGTSTKATAGKSTKPGAMSVTMLHARTPEEVTQVSHYSRQVVPQMMAIPGFIGFRGVTVGASMLTLTAWEDLDGPRKLMTESAHVDAMRRFFGTEVAASGYTSVWVPARINPYWVRCGSCDKMVDSEKSSGTCTCGATLPDTPAYL